jgi:putative flippase GtrA
MQVQAKREARVFSAYLGASVIALAADGASYYLLLKLHMMASQAAAVAYILGIAIHYLVSRHSIQARSSSGQWTRHQSITFILSGLAGVLVTTVTVFVLHELMRLGPALAKIAAVASSFLSVYLLRRSLIFKVET